MINKGKEKIRNKLPMPNPWSKNHPKREGPKIAPKRPKPTEKPIPVDLISTGYDFVKKG